MRLLLISAVILLFTPGQIHATHLIGGNVSYSHAGPDPNIAGNTLFELRFQAYLDCSSIHWSPGTPGGFPENPIEFGVFEGALNDNSINFHSTVDLTFNDFDTIQPQLPDGCNFALNNCVAIVQYEGTVSLPPSADGYHIMYDRCCRPGGIINLDIPEDQPLTYKVFIPSEENSTALMNNSSAFFNDTLSSYMCRNDTTSIPNSAVDPDGDSLVFNLVRPHAGSTEPAGGVGPVANWQFPPFNPYPNPPNPVNWAAGHDETQKFGANGYQNINPITGSTQFMSPNTGVYVAAVEISEFRNGNLISVTRRDIQLLVVDCPGNSAPAQDTSNLDTFALDPEFYEVHEGTSFCFDLEYYDAEGDSVFLEASGNIFDPNITNPTATIQTPLQGDSALVTELCWNTTCDQGRSNPYQFTVNVTDDGCPPRTAIQNFSIRVIPLIQPQVIAGDSIVCSGDGPFSYSIPSQHPDFEIGWTVTGGTIVSGDSTETIEVDWTANSGTIEVEIENPAGCKVLQDIAISTSQVSADAGSDTLNCIGDSVLIGGGNAPQGASVSWAPLAGVTNPDSIFTFVKPDTTTTYILTVIDTLGCEDKDTVTVSVFDPVPAGLLPDYYRCPSDTMFLTPEADSVTWNPNDFIVNQNDSAYGFYPPQDTTYILDYTDTNGCRNTDTIHFTVNEQVPTVAGPDTALCSGESIILGGDPTALPPVSFSWTPSAGLSDDTAANPEFTGTQTTTYILETSSDTCRGFDTVTITVNELPDMEVTGDTHICAGDSAPLFTSLQTGTFEWSHPELLTDSLDMNPTAFPETTTVFMLTLTDSNGCVNQDSAVIEVNPIPDALTGGEQFFVCKNDSFELGSANADPNLNYTWSPGNNLNFDSIPNPVFSSDSSQMIALEVNDSIGCNSRDTVMMEILRISAGFDTTVCPRDEVPAAFTAQGGSDAITYEYFPETYVDDPNSPSTVIRPEESEEYFVVVTDTGGCSDTAEISINFAPLPEPEPAYSFKPGCDETMIILENENFEAEGSYWVIDGGAERMRTEPDSAVYQLGTSMNILLITKNDSGCADTAEINISPQNFKEVLDLDMPNVFTPNGDGINDFFEFRGNDQLITCVQMRIFNRWGNLIYESKPGHTSWNGRNFSGEKVPQGVYYYILNVRELEFKGSVTLFR